MGRELDTFSAVPPAAVVVVGTALTDGDDAVETAPAPVVAAAETKGAPSPPAAAAEIAADVVPLAPHSTAAAAAVEHRPAAAVN